MTKPRKAVKPDQPKADKKLDSWRLDWRVTGIAVSGSLSGTKEALQRKIKELEKRFPQGISYTLCYYNQGG